MTTLAEVDVVINAKLDPLLAASKQAEKVIRDLDAKLNGLANKKYTPTVSVNVANNQKLDELIKKLNDLANKKVVPVVNPNVKPAIDSIDSLKTSVSRLATGLVAGLSVKEVAEYADAWTNAGNKIASAALGAGVQTRSLQELNKLASESRSGIEETVDLYSKLIRSSSGVAKSENDIATATTVVLQAFKASGASISEQKNAILQLGQALGSGVLQGDELRSIRENSPLLAKAIAKEFGTTVAGLKKLGAEGKLTSEKVFSGILKAAPEIAAQFETTKGTISDAITGVKNAFTEFVGTNGLVQDSVQKVIASLNYLANNFASIAPVVLQFVTVITGAFIGRAMLGLVASVATAVIALAGFVTSMAAGTAAAITFEVALGPIGLLAGAAAAAIYLISSSNTEAEASGKSHAEALKELSFQIENVDYANGSAVASTRQKIASDIAAAKAALGRASAERELAAAIIKSEVQPGMKLYPSPDAEDVDNTVKQSPLVVDRQALIDELNNQITALEDSQKHFEDIAAGRAKPVRQGAGSTAGYGNGIANPNAGKKKKGKESAYAKETEDIAKRTAVLNAQTEAQSKLDPLISDYGYAVSQAKAAQELLTAAQKSGTAAGKELKDVNQLIKGDFSDLSPAAQAQAESMLKLADGYAAATANAKQLSESQEMIKKHFEETKELGKDALGGFIKDLEQGKTAGEALAGVLQKLADKLLDVGLNMLFGIDQGSGPASQGALGGILAPLSKALFGGFFADGGTPPMGKASVVGENGPELFVPHTAGVIVPNNQLKPSVGSSGGASSVGIHMNVTTDSAQIVEIANTQIKSAAPTIVKASVSQGQKQTKQNMGGYIANAQARQI